MWNPLGVAGYGSDSDSSGNETETHEVAQAPDVVDGVDVAEEVSATPQPAAPLDGAPAAASSSTLHETPDYAPTLPDLPELPRTRCDASIQAKIDKYLEHKERGMSFVGSLRSKKEFDNPYILAKVVEYFGIEEMQSNFPKDVFDPYGYDLDDYMDKLTMALQKEQERRAMLVQQNPALRWTQPTSLS